MSKCKHRISDSKGNSKRSEHIMLQKLASSRKNSILSCSFSYREQITQRPALKHFIFRKLSTFLFCYEIIEEFILLW